MSIVVMKQVTKVYALSRVEAHALRGVDLEVTAGEMVAITGPSGSGKSTLLHVAGALGLPTAGELTILGQDLRSLSDDRLAAFRRQRLGFVFQFFNLAGGQSLVEGALLQVGLAGGAAFVAPWAASRAAVLPACRAPTPSASCSRRPSDRGLSGSRPGPA